MNKTTITVIFSITILSGCDRTDSNVVETKASNTLPEYPIIFQADSVNANKPDKIELSEPVVLKGYLQGFPWPGYGFHYALKVKDFDSIILFPPVSVSEEESGRLDKIMYDKEVIVSGEMLTVCSKETLAQYPDIAACRHFNPDKPITISIAE